MMVPIYWGLVVANVVGFGTWLGGWWMLPVGCLLAAALAPTRATSWLSVPLGAALGWAVLLWRSARSPGFSSLREMLADLLPLPPTQLAGVTLAFPLVLGLGAALLVAGLRRRPQPETVVPSHQKEN